MLLTGGVSMGKYDLVEQVLGELKAEFYFTRVEIQPGRPTVFGSCGRERRSSACRQRGRPVLRHADKSVRATQEIFFGLPGNPVSTMVTFELFARPMIEALSGNGATALGFSARPAEVGDPD